MTHSKQTTQNLNPEDIAEAERLADMIDDGTLEFDEPPVELAALRAAVRRLQLTQDDVTQVVLRAAQAGQSWRAIGSEVGVSGERARQKYAETVVGALGRPHDARRKTAAVDGHRSA